MLMVQNMLAEALKPYGGIVFWRAFVYQNERHVDRVINGYNEFKPLDGEFAENVFVQPKNGPIDFQPREPFHPIIRWYALYTTIFRVSVTAGEPWTCRTSGISGYSVRRGPSIRYL